MSSRAARVRIGMVGGGPDAGIGPAHRYAMRLDGRYDLVAGVFSRSADKSARMGRELGISESRVYSSPHVMAEQEAQRADGIEIVSVVTPNDSHYEIARAFLMQDIPVVCDKPLTDRLGDARELVRLCEERSLFVALTHNYSGYGMVRHAARLVQAGSLGPIRMVQVEHASGWGSEPVERTGRKQAVWRTDPAIAGAASVLFDLGTHAHHLLRFVTGLEVDAVSADMSTVVDGRKVFDSAFVNLRMSNGARGALWVTMAATGHEHGLRIRVYGPKASLEWQHEDPQHLTVRHGGGRREVHTMGMVGVSADAERVRRLGIGQAEGFIEALANLYRDVADELAGRSAGRLTDTAFAFPTANDGVTGLKFVEAVVASHERDGVWTETTGLS
jgi:predicted dehydrogenase